MGLFRRLFFKSNEDYIEEQLRKQFKPPKMPKKVTCEYCGKVLTKGTKRRPGDRIGRWIYSDGVTYHCMSCFERIQEVRLNVRKDICLCYSHGYEPTIERCLNCPQSKICEESQMEAEKGVINGQNKK